MFIDTKKVKEVLMNKEMTGYALWKATGVSQQAISRLRSGKKRFEELSLETIMKIQSWIDEKQKAVYTVFFYFRYNGNFRKCLL